MQNKILMQNKKRERRVLLQIKRAGIKTDFTQMILV
jgi:hypothetical protein